MTLLDRRQLLHGSAAAAAAAGLSPLGRTARLRSGSPNEELRVACVGVRGRGRSHMHGFQRLEGVEVVALVEVDSEVGSERRAELEKIRGGARVDLYEDIREVLDRDDIDAVSLATPNHLHALHGIWACQSGKHVYVEKPVSHNVFEGRQLVRAAERYGRVVQCGTQARSSPGIGQAIAWLHEGHLGEVRAARGICFKRRPSIGNVTTPREVGAHVNWDLYCGPAPLEPLRRENLHYDWHWQFETGNGDLGNQGVHQMDLARWAIGASGLCRGVGAFGGRLGYSDDGDTPNSMVVLLDYEQAPILFEVRGLPRSSSSGDAPGEMDQHDGMSIGVTVECEGGRLRIPHRAPPMALDLDGREMARWSEGGDDHFANFIEAVRANDPGVLEGGILEGHLSSALCHLGNASYRVGARRSADAIRRELGANQLAREGVDRLDEHLRSNGLDIKGDVLTFGPYLEVDLEAERFRHDELANALLTRSYRAPFIVPEEV